ncbi:YbaB/EbfC family nucleoid-associated protein [Mycobacterium sp. Dal123C01]|uniref:YbaB/EbfC family nucleoid-associated protein n=1 Tax=Mycobacterium sp. Dal123C01 TaxID=3457577 RepID=UPI00403E373F
MSNDAASHEFAHVLSLVQGQMRDLSVMQQRRAALTATASAADGTVKITVDAQQVVTKTVIDESYLDEFELADLAGYITTAAQEAAQEVERQAAALLAPLTARRQEISSLSGLVTDAPDFSELISALHSPAQSVPASWRADDGDDGPEQPSSFPTVRR